MMNIMDTSSLKEQLSSEMDGKLFTLSLYLGTTEVMTFLIKGYPP